MSRVKEAIAGTFSPALILSEILRIIYKHFIFLHKGRSAIIIILEDNNLPLFYKSARLEIRLGRSYALTLPGTQLSAFSVHSVPRPAPNSRAFVQNFFWLLPVVQTIDSSTQKQTGLHICPAREGSIREGKCGLVWPQHF